MATPDADLRAMLRNPLYRESWRPGSAAHRAATDRAWEDRYPGAAQMDATGKQVRVNSYQRAVEIDGATITQNVRDYVQTRSGRGRSPTGNPAHVDAYFDRAYEPMRALADRLGTRVEFVLGLSSYESGWLDTHNTGLNNPFGLTRAGGKNLRFDSIDAAVRYWERLYGDQVRGAATAEEFADRLLGRRNGQQVAGWRVYNTVNPDWRARMLANIRSVERRLPPWTQSR
ncbi:hypothetical protein [Roseomonas sp. CECT 9278]|uniref:hypothetical protein n=1 Tax=Roseomonas sp. CECT 9278 TaxID=2845823 RepID=UPI001E4CABB1|nr:hypothetical protein [Roseomonas sp. CECT 9278]